MSELRKNVSNLYLRLYPNLTIEEIQEEMTKFEKAIKDSGISESSSNFSKYQRGWLMKANMLKEIK